jgi:predicted ATPase with chaperone activity
MPQLGAGRRTEIANVAAGPLNLGLAAFTIVGLTDRTIQEARERVKRARASPRP